MSPFVKEKVKEEDLREARKMVERAYKPLIAESKRRFMKRPFSTMQPKELCPDQGWDVVSRI